MRAHAESDKPANAQAFATLIEDMDKSLGGEAFEIAGAPSADGRGFHDADLTIAASVRLEGASPDAYQQWECCLENHTHLQTLQAR